jgi:hypothetical protein
MECGDVNGLVGRLETVLGSFSKTKEMGDHGKQNFRELFIAKRTGDRFIKMYHPGGRGLDQECLEVATRR